MEVSVNSFIPALKQFLHEKNYLFSTYDENNQTNITMKTKKEDSFLEYVTEFLYTPGINKAWKESFVFSGNESLVCGKKSPPIQAFKFRIHNLM